MPARVPMTAAQREALLALPDAEVLLVRHHGLNERDLLALNTARTPETRLGYALQLCCLRYPGRHFRRGELLPGPMLGHIAEQIDVDAAVIAGFARRVNTRYDQLVAVKARFGYVVTGWRRSGCPHVDDLKIAVVDPCPPDAQGPPRRRGATPPPRPRR